MVQLFQNLIGNALKFRRRARRPCAIYAVEDSDRVTFAVADNGIGISPEHLERVFGMFQRLHTAAEYPGTGIGLAICKRIVERHGGRIWAVSEVGRGSTFCFTIPRVAKPASGGVALGRRVEGMNGVTKPLYVLLIEDSPEEAELIQVMLAQSRREVLHVQHVSRLADGLARLASDPVDVVLLDFSLPDSSGLVSFEKARKVAPHVPIVILTNLDDEETALSAVREGAQDYLVKRQVDNELLLRSIRYAISRMLVERAMWESEERYALRSTAPTTGSGTGT